MFAAVFGALKGTSGGADNKKKTDEVAAVDGSTGSRQIETQSLASPKDGGIFPAVTPHFGDSVAGLTTPSFGTTDAAAKDVARKTAETAAADSGMPGGTKSGGSMLSDNEKASNAAMMAMLAKMGWQASENQEILSRHGDGDEFTNSPVLTNNLNEEKAERFIDMLQGKHRSIGKSALHVPDGGTSEEEKTMNVSVNCSPKASAGHGTKISLESQEDELDQAASSQKAETPYYEKGAAVAAEKTQPPDGDPLSWTPPQAATEIALSPHGLEKLDEGDAGEVSPILGTREGAVAPAPVPAIHITQDTANSSLNTTAASSSTPKKAGPPVYQDTEISSVSVAVVSEATYFLTRVIARATDPRDAPISTIRFIGLP